MVSLNENVVEKINIKCKQIDCSPEDLINDILHDYLSDVEEIHDGLDAEKILAMLDHDKPEGDDVLEILSNVNKLK